MSRLLDGDNDVLSTSGSTTPIDSTATETTPFTVVMWIKRGQVSFGVEETLWINGGLTATNQLHIGVINTDNTISLRARTSANSTAPGTVAIADTTNWHMVAFKVVSTTQGGVSVDGGAFELTTYTARDPTTASAMFRVGGTLAATPVNEFTGRVSWIGVWNLALTNPNITALWNSGAGLNLSNIAAPVAVWDLNDNQSPELNNVSPGTYDLTVAGATFSSDDPFTIGGGASTTVAPAQATITMVQWQASMNPFTNVRIREVLINEAGSPVANKTGIHLKVWYAGRAAGAPDLSYSDMTTDGSGSTSWSLATGSLIYNQPVFYVADDGGTSLSMYTCGRLIPTYS